VAFRPGAMGELVAVLVRAFIFLILFVMARSLLRSLWSAFTSGGASSSASQRAQVQQGGELKRDPVCGTYVSPAVSLTGKSNGETVYFCSPECRDKYLAQGAESVGRERR
jgi:YHS domain-containing protein